MPDELPSIQIDTDWKKQAQEEKRRLAEQQKQEPPAMSPTGGVGAATTTAPGDPRDARQRGTRQMPQASFATLVQSIVTQALFSLGEISIRGQAPSVDLDSAKLHIDTLGVIEEKTRSNLTPEEQKLLDSALYETRMRYVNVASQYIS